MRNTRLVAAAIALAMPLTGFASVPGIAVADVDIATAGEPERTAARAGSGINGDDTTMTVLDRQFMPLERGSYRLTTLGDEITMRIDADYWMVKDNRAGMTVISDAGLAGSNSQDIILAIPSQLAVPSSARLTNAMDIDAWLDAVDDDVLVGVPFEVVVDGRPAMRFDIHLTMADESEAIAFVGTPAGDSVSFESGRNYNVWWIGGPDPLAIIAASDAASHPFLYQAEQLLDGLAFKG